MTNIAIIDSNDLILTGITFILSGEEDFKVVGTTNDYKNISSINSKLNPDLLMISIDDNIDYVKYTVRYLLEDNPNIKLIAMTEDKENKNLIKSINCGFHGYILKSDSKNSMISCIKEIIQGNAFINPQATTDFLNEYFKLNEKVKRNENLNRFYGLSIFDVLNPRESSILELIISGNSNRKIGERLFISDKTVNNHVSDIIRKLNVKDRTQAAVVGIKSGWVDIN